MSGAGMRKVLREAILAVETLLDADQEELVKAIRTEPRLLAIS